MTARELLCMSCGVEYPVWYADNDLWNATVRHADGSDEWDFLCPTCFMGLAARRGVETAFRVSRYEPYNGAENGIHGGSDPHLRCTEVDGCD